MKEQFFSFSLGRGLVLGLFVLILLTVWAGMSAFGQPKGAVEAKKRLEAIEAAKKDAQAAGGRVEAPAGKKIGYIHLSAQTEASVRVLEALQEAANLFEFEVIVCDPNFDRAKLQQCATSVVAQNPDVVITEAADPRAAAAGIKEAHKRGIPWINVGAGQPPSEYLTAQYVPDEKESTRILDAWFFNKIREKVGAGSPAEIMAFQFPTVGPAVRARDEQRRLDVAAAPTVTEVVTHDTDIHDPIQDTIKKVRQVIEQKPHIAGIWETGDFCVPPIAQVLNSKGLKGKSRPIVVGFYSTKESRAGLLDGSVDGVVENNFDNMGWVAFDQCLEYWARGKPFPPDNKVFREGYSLDFMVPWMHTKYNVDPDINIISNQGPDYKTYFKTKWYYEFGVGEPPN